VATIRVPFTVTIASAVAPAGYVYDVQVKRPGSSHYVGWLHGVTAPAADYTAQSPGAYRFRARMRNLKSGEAAGWSPAAIVVVS
jgi:hypothetical protein